MNDDDILNAIAPHMDGIITAYVLIAEYVDSDGDKQLYTATMPDQRSHTTLGLLAYGDTVERLHTVRTYEDT